MRWFKGTSGNKQNEERKKILWDFSLLPLFFLITTHAKINKIIICKFIIHIELGKEEKTRQLERVNDGEVFIASTYKTCDRREMNWWGKRGSLMEIGGKLCRTHWSSRFLNSIQWREAGNENLFNWVHWMWVNEVSNGFEAEKWHGVKIYKAGKKLKFFLMSFKFLRRFFWGFQSWFGLKPLWAFKKLSKKFKFYFLKGFEFWKVSSFWEAFKKLEPLRSFWRGLNF